MTIRNAATMGGYGAAWEHEGYCGSGNVVDLLGSLQGRTALVCGNGGGVFEEFEEVYQEGMEVFGCNDVGVYLPWVHHMVSLHCSRLKLWRQLRQDGAGESRGNRDFKAHTITDTPGIDYHWDGLCPTFALSGYFAMQIAYLMGAERIILCGCPGLPVPRFFEARPRKDNFGYGKGTKGNSDNGVMTQLTNEMKRLPGFKARVHSTSGWTREFFGAS